MKPFFKVSFNSSTYGLNGLFSNVNQLYIYKYVFVFIVLLYILFYIYILNNTYKIAGNAIQIIMKSYPFHLKNIQKNPFTFPFLSASQDKPLLTHSRIIDQASYIFTLLIFLPELQRADRTVFKMQESLICLYARITNLPLISVYSVYFGFIICKMGIIRVSTSQDCEY